MSSTDRQSSAIQLGERLKEMRAALDMTQVELAEALEVAVRSIKRYEAGTSTIPSDVVLRMMNLGIDPAYLFGAAESFHGSSAAGPQIDEVILREVVDWVDGEWSETGPMEELERLTWIVREYMSTVRQRRAEARVSGESEIRRRRKA